MQRAVIKIGRGGKRQQRDEQGAVQQPVEQEPEAETQQTKEVLNTENSIPQPDYFWWPKKQGEKYSNL